MQEKGLSQYNWLQNVQICNMYLNENYNFNGDQDLNLNTLDLENYR